MEVIVMDKIRCEKCFHPLQGVTERIAELESELLTTKKALFVTARERQELEAERDKLTKALEDRE
jgi:hypothetical protein